jgi:RNA-directed DNA polymerase
MATQRSAPAQRAASSGEPMDWHLIDWGLVQMFVGKMQMRIAQAEMDKDYRRVKRLQRSLVRSWQAKALAVRKVTENQGKRTSGVDRELWPSPDGQMERGVSNEHRDTGPSHCAESGSRNRTGKNVRWEFQPCSTGRCRPCTCSRWSRCQSARPIRIATAFAKDDPRTMPGASCLCRYPRRASAQWVLDADITGFFDNINHEWLLANVHMNKRVLQQWLKAGVIDRGQLHRTEMGTPQGGIMFSDIGEHHPERLGARTQTVPQKGTGVQRRCTSKGESDSVCRRLCGDRRLEGASGHRGPTLDCELPARAGPAVLRGEDQGFAYR